MESVGEKLKTAREQQGYTIEQVARETNIAKRFIQALEDENFSEFPGEAYLTGFLKNYADYLGLDAPQVVSLYKNLRIQEQDVPLDELLETKKPNFGLFIILGIVVIGALVALGIFVIPPAIEAVSGLLNSGEPADQVSEDYTGTVYEFGDKNDYDGLFREKDSLRFVFNEETYEIKILSIGDVVQISYLGENDEVRRTYENHYIDFDGDDNEDLTFYIEDIDKNAEIPTVDIHFEKPAPPVIAEYDLTVENSAFTSIGSSTNAQRIRDAIVLISSEAPVAIALELTFTGYCVIQYRVDGGNREQRTFQKDESYTLDGEKEIMLWVSNAGAIGAKANGNEFDLGTTGEVVTELIKWVKAEEGGAYELKRIPAY